MKQVKQLCREMLYGIAIWTVLMAIVLAGVAVWLGISPLSMIFGVFMGGGTAAGLLFHMYRHLDIALDMNPEGASKHTQFAAIQRMFVMAAIMAVAFVWMDYVHPAGVAFGILGMKATALAYPKFHVFCSKRFSKDSF